MGEEATSSSRPARRLYSAPPSMSSSRSPSPGGDAPPSYSQAIAGIDVTDGRVNLDIGDFSRRLEPLVSSLEHNLQASSNEVATTAPEGQVPRLNIVLQVVGSRGDVQPFVALGKALQNYGHRVRIATHPTFQKFVETYNLEFFSIGGDPSELMAYMVKNPGLIPRMSTLTQGEVPRRRRMMRDIMNGCWRSCIEPGDGLQPKSAKQSEALEPFIADAIIANPPSFAHIHCAEKLGVPVHIFFTMPWTPTTEFEHPLANLREANLKSERRVANRLSYYMVDALAWQGLGDIVNKFRHKTLDLEPINPMRAIGLISWCRIPHTYCWPSSLLSKPSDWAPEIGVTGYALLDQKNSYEPPPHLLKFLEAGPPPVYIGFGSIVVDDPASLTRTVLEAIERTNQRAIISQGWAGMGTNDTTSANVLFIEDCPHDWLFPRVAAVVHHGGSGTTAAGLCAGIPTVIIPFFGDQPFWGQMIYRTGAGPAPIPHKVLNAENLANAITSALHPSVRTKAQSIAALIAKEDGNTAAMQNFHAHLPLKDWRCSVDESRSAVWETRKGKLRLSAVAASVLIQEKELDARDLKLFRVWTQDLSQGPWEPMSGAAYAIVDLFFDTFKGMGEILADVALTPQNTARMIKKRSEKNDAEGSQDGKSVDSKSSRVPGELSMNGSWRIFKAAARAPGEFTLAMAQGSHNLPKLWGDSTVRPMPKVTGVGSGLMAGVSELCLGTYDGISGLFVQPVRDIKQHGPVGLVTGLAKGVVGMPVKFWSGASAIVGYPLKGVDRSMTKLFDGTGQAIKKARLEQGVREAAVLSSGERQAFGRELEAIEASEE